MRELRAIEEGFNSPAAQAIAVALYAYEEQQSLAKGRRFRANRTRQMLERHGALHAAERMVLSRKPSTGFDVLEGAGLQLRLPHHPAGHVHLVLGLVRQLLQRPAIHPCRCSAENKEYIIGLGS